MKQLFLVIILLTIQKIIVSAQPGTLDSSFGNQGTIIGEGYTGECRDILIQQDGKIIAAGTGIIDGTKGFILAGYNEDGTVNADFGDSGKALIIFDNVVLSGVNLTKAVLQEDGKIVSVGAITINSGGVNNNLVLARTNPDGSLDISFGTGGKVATDIKTFEGAVGVGILPDGKIVVGGTTSDPDTTSDGGNLYTLFVIRYNADGSLDESFGNNGLYQEPVDDAIRVNGFALQTDGKILLGGEYWVRSDEALFVRRYLQTGLPDTQFGSNGEALIVFPDVSSSYLSSIALQIDGSILTGGSIFKTGTNKRNAALAQLNSNGSLNTSFGDNGFKVLDIPGLNTRISDLAIQSDGKVVASLTVSEAAQSSNSKFGVSRFLSDGSLDSSYGENGLTITETEDYLYSYTIALQSNGKAIVGGYAYMDDPPAGSYYALTRYAGDTEQQPRFVRIKKWLHRHGFTWDDWPGRNISYYAVQRSGNGNNFTEIARLSPQPLKGSNDANRFEDNNLLNGINYYRLAAVSADGAVVYSNVLAIPNNTSAIKIYPNPAKNNLQVEGLPATEKTKLVITDINGVTSMSTTINTSRYNWNISNLKPGNYMLQVITKGNAVTAKKFVKE